MANESEIEIKNVTNSTINIEVTQILAHSYQYKELLGHLKTQQRLFALLPEDRTEERLAVSQKLNDLESEIEAFKRSVLQLAEQFNRIEINTDRLKRAKAFFDQGDIGEARAVLESELEQMQDEQTRLLVKKEEYETETLPKLINNADEFLILALSTQTDYANPNWLTDTCNYFERSIKSHPTKNNIFQYAVFLQDHNYLNQAIYHYNLYLEIFKSEFTKADYATILNNLGILHKAQNRYEEALQEFEEALRLYQQLSENDSSTYLPYVAIVLNNLAGLRKDQNKYEEALQEFEEALQIRRQLAQTNPTTYLPNVATSLNNLAVLHQDQNKYEEALQEFEEALQIRRQLAQANPTTYLPNVATSLNNLAILHEDQNKYEEALQEFEEALQIRRQLAESNPTTYLPNVATSLNNLAALHQDQNRYEEALREFEETLQIYRQLAENSPSAYLPYVAATLINLAIFYLQADPNRRKSIELAIEALLIVQPIAEKLPYTQKYLQIAEAVLGGWGLSEEEIGQMIEEKMKD